ncbi:ABC transporter permease subunit [Paenibacillus sp. WQ 127069]|uniref:ABC transporter permease subunit n=1 Tax=Paenibacillus baimaensis TaxID=2982185 RepID=A0ABT2UD09_9BACL|nr:ABC transporter permease subunit [Paenibacillus sp. WQ 127069]MCU6792528.1 ABC transporter permease subunit [Paenibacillus sp. WQ 127069]
MKNANAIRTSKGGLQITVIGKKKALKVIQNYQLYLLFLPTFLFFIIFHYGPMYGLQIAFKDFNFAKGITGSPWIGFDHFERFFRSRQFWTLIKNTLGLSLYNLLVGFPVPIILALSLNQITRNRFRRFAQTITYAPHFISTVVLVGMMSVFLSPSTGLINHLITFLGGDPIYFFGEAGWFQTLHVFSGVWQHAGWGAIIYLAVLAGVDPGLHEAAIVDGANKFQRIRHIDFPSIIPTAVILLILNFGTLLTVGFEKTFLIQTPLNIASSEVIATYVYKTGLLGSQFSYSAAIGLFDSVINLILLIAVNRLARKFTESSLW